MVRQVALGFVVVVLALGTALAAGPRRLALVVGTGHGAVDQVKLKHAERDASKLAHVLGELGGVEARDLLLLTKGPRAEDVLSAFDQMEERAAAERDAGREVMFLFYYSGHATVDHLQLAGSRLSLKALRHRLRTSRATVRLAIIDACHSGGIVRQKGGNRHHGEPVSFAIDQKLRTEGYAILTSSSASEKSQESDALLGSFFTHFLVSGLRGAADVDGDQQITLVEAFRYAYARTLRQTVTRSLEPQHPHVELALKGAPDVVVTALEQAQATVVLRPGGNARWIIFDPNEKRVIAELEANSRPVSLAVPSGFFTVYRQGHDGLAKGKLDIRSGDRVVLSDDLVSSVSLASYLRKGESGLSVSAMVGIQSFLNTGIRSKYVGASPVFSALLQYRGVFVDELDLVTDVGFTHQSQRLLLENDHYSQLLTMIQVGIGLPYRFDFGNFSTSLGPRIAYVYLRRRVYLGDEESTQEVSTVAPGVSLGFTWRFSSVMSLGVRARISYVRLPTDAGDQNGVFTEAHVVSGFHF